MDLKTEKFDSDKPLHIDDTEHLPRNNSLLPGELGQDISYGPSGIRGVFSSGYVFGASFLASLGGFSFGYDQGVISIINVMPVCYSALRS
jgi:hypothetical protein